LSDAREAREGAVMEGTRTMMRVKFRRKKEDMVLSRQE
jgi:hypothetical protein